MTIQDVFDRLRPIEKAARELIRDTGFDPDEGLGDKVRHLPDSCEDAFLRDKAEGILESLEDVSSEISYLRKPLHGEHTLRKFPNGRYGYTGGNQAVREFTCGDCLEAKIRDRYGNLRWITSSIEHDGTDYFLVGSLGAPLSGLTVRERW
ncbi:MAG: DUF5348 domain-containing protein [Clostridiales bacterium]|nr:DUF5348 domain-containing protein [Clostridiales bacterium]